MKNKDIIIAISEIILGAYLIVCEIRNYLKMPSIYEQGIYELVDFFIYKEDTYSLAFLWFVLFFSGCSYWLNKKTFWIFNQVFTITFFLSFVLLLRNHHISNAVYLIPLLLVFAEVNLWRQESINSKQINYKSFVLSVVLGLIFTLIYWLLNQ